MRLSLSLVALSLASSTFALYATPPPPQPTANVLKTIELAQRHELEKRQFQLIPVLVGFFLQVAEGTEELTLANAIGNALKAIFGGDDPSPWNPASNKCTFSYSTHGGGECKSTTTAKGHSSSHPQGSWSDCAWLDPGNSDPPIQYFNDPGVGDYSVQFTATDEYAWPGIANTKKCIVQGLCNPRITFYRDHYSFILDTWLSVGDKTEGGYFGDYGGLCGNGPVKNQFRPNGNEIGFDCGIPCEGAFSLPGTNGDPAPELPTYTWSFPPGYPGK